MSRPARRPYQETGAQFLDQHPRAFLGDEGGLGKSRQLVETAKGRTLVVAPGMVLDGGTWSNDDPDNPGELQKWADDPSQFTTAAYSSLNQRVATDRKSTTGNTVYKVVPRLKEDFAQEWETLILDEAHYVKNRDANWTIALQNLAAKTPNVRLATGTPFPNWAHELFVPLTILYPEEAARGRKFGSYWRWVDEWFSSTPLKHNPRAKKIGDLAACSERCLKRPATDPCDHYLEFIAENLGDRYLGRRRDDVLADLPPATRQTIEVPMTAAQAKAYREMKKNFVITVDGEELMQWTEGSMFVMLDRITTGLGVLGIGKVSIKDSGKFERLAWDLASRSRPTLVVGHYRESLEGAARVAESVGARTRTIHGLVSKADRAKFVNEFKSGQCDVLVGSLETVAEGLNLQVSDQIIFIEKSYKPSRNTQAEWRVHRQGQTRPVTILDYVSVLPGARRGRTVDGNKRLLLDTKNDRQMRALTAAQFAQLL